MHAKKMLAKKDAREKRCFPKKDASQNTDDEQTRCRLKRCLPKKMPAKMMPGTEDSGTKRCQIKICQPIKMPAKRDASPKR